MKHPALNREKTTNKRANKKQADKEVVRATSLKARYTEVIRLRQEISRIAAKIDENRLSVWRTLN